MDGSASVTALRPGPGSTGKADGAPNGPGTAANGPLHAYRARIANGSLAPDSAQALAAERLPDLWRRLRGYDPHPQKQEEPGLLARFFRRKPVEDAVDSPNGLYLVGEVGRGKSMLMDLFFDAAEVPRKRRVHFHA